MSAAAGIIRPPTFAELARREQERRKLVRETKEEAEQDFLAFVRMMWPVLEPETPLVEGWLLDLLADTLMAVTDGHLTRVCINVPPGSSKSSLLNVLWPAWEWGPCNKPHLRYLSLSYSTAVPIRDNLRFLQVIRHPRYQACWGDRVKIGRDGAEWVSNSATGWKMVTSTGGGVTGFRGDRILADDVNNPMSVESDTVRATTNRFMREILPTRLNNLQTSAIINLQQRTHENDATATLIEHGQGYTFICVPMEFDALRIGRAELTFDEDGEPDHVWIDPRSLDEDGRQLRGLTTNPRGEPMVEMGSPMAKAEGESCWPERFPADAVASLKTTMTDYAWSSQMNQIPGVRGGAIIKRDWWKLWTGEYPEMGTVIVSLDTAIEEGESNDYNGCTAWGAFAGTEGEPLFLLLDAWKERMTLAKLVAKVAETCRQRKADYLLIEHKTRGRDVHDEVLRLYQNATWETVLVKPAGDKVSRLNAVSHLFSGDVRRVPDGGKDVKGLPTYIESWTGGMVYAPDRDFAEMVIAEVASFPYGANDDLVDSCSMALGFARKNGVVLRKAEFDEQELERNRYRKPSKVPYSIRKRA